LDDGSTNGTALWLGAQCLSMYLLDILRAKPRADGQRRRAIELGSGIGLSACSKCTPSSRIYSGFIGWDVLATDLPDVIAAVLYSNVANNASQLPVDSGVIQVRALDWTIPPQEWVWDSEEFIAAPSSSRNKPYSDGHQTIGPPFDLIISSDTLYSPDIVIPLLRTLHTLCTLSMRAAASIRSPPVYLCIERRDPDLIDQALEEARVIWGFVVERVPHRKVVKAMDKGGVNWEKGDWEGVEIWKLMLPVSKQPKEASSQ
ncbi:uncharacterized protein LAESUDRAFT_642221, partial [Laetiporus sulphureus 93-53]